MAETRRGRLRRLALEFSRSVGRPLAAARPSIDTRVAAAEGWPAVEPVSARLLRPRLAIRPIRTDVAVKEFVTPTGAALRHVRRNAPDETLRHNRVVALTRQLLEDVRVRPLVPPRNVPQT